MKNPCVDWQLRVWRVAEAIQPPPGEEAGELHSEGGIAGLSFRFAERTYKAQWLRDRTQESIERANARALAALRNGDPKWTEWSAAEGRAHAELRAARAAAELFLVATGQG